MPDLPTIEEIRDTFDFLGDWEERFSYIIDLGKRVPALPPADCTDDARVHGCQAQVWLHLNLDDGLPPRVHIRAMSDAHIVNGLIAIVTALYDGRTPAEVLAVDAAQVLRDLGLDAHLSGTRRNGLDSMIRRIRELAAQAGSTA